MIPHPVTLRTWSQNLLSTAGAIGAAAVPFVWQSTPGESPDHALLTALGFGAATTLSSIFSGVISSELRDSFKDRLSDSKSLLSNGHWHRLVALAASELIREAAKESGRDAETLRRLANGLNEEWSGLIDHPGFASQFEELSKSEAKHWFDRTDQMPQALDETRWSVILKAVGTKHDGRPDDNTLGQLAERLTRQLPHATFDLLCDQQVGNEARSGLFITLLSELHGSLCERLPKVAEMNSSAIAEQSRNIADFGRRLEELMDRLVTQMPDSIEKQTLRDHLAEDRKQWSEACDQLDAIRLKMDKLQDSVDELLRRTPQTPALPREPESPPASRPTKAVSNLHEHFCTRRPFVGRKVELERLRRSLNRKRPTAVSQTKAIHALGGIGKTQLAIEYARTHAEDYDLIWFLRAENTQTLTADLTALIDPLGLPEDWKQVSDQRQVLHAVFQTLHTGSRRWLLIYDNAESPGALNGLLPPMAAHGHVLITSRNPNWGGHADSLPLDVFTDKEAADFLLQRTGQRDRSAALNVAARLGRLPLALEQAGAFCEATGLPLADYCDYLERNGLNHLDQYQPQQYHSLIMATWLPNFEAARRDCPKAEELLTLIAFLDADAIPHSLFANWSEGDLHSAVAALRRYSLLDRADGTVSTHRLVQEVCRSRLNGDELRQGIQAALDVVDSAIPGDPPPWDVRSWPLWDALGAHVRQVVTHADRIGIADPTSRLLNQLGSHFFSKAMHAEAEPLMRRALAIDELSFGAEHPKVAIRLNNLAQLLQATNRLAEAEPLMRRALAIDEQSFGAEHPNVARDLNNLSLLLQDTKRLAEALPLMERAVAIYRRFESQNGFRHPDWDIVLQSYQQMLQAAGMPEAEIQRRFRLPEHSL